MRYREKDDGRDYPHYDNYFYILYNATLEYFRSRIDKEQHQIASYTLPQARWSVVLNQAFKLPDLWAHLALKKVK